MLGSIAFDAVELRRFGSIASRLRRQQGDSAVIATMLTGNSLASR